jgi:hypothetical protein
MLDKEKIYMINKWMFINLLFCLVLLSCSNYNIVTHPITIDSTAACVFTYRINQRFTNYGDASGYNHIMDSIRATRLHVRGPSYNSRIMNFHVGPTKEEFIIYTFDKKDSCVLVTHHDSLNDAFYELNTASIPIPMGRYLLKYGEYTTNLDCP